MEEKLLEIAKSILQNDTIDLDTNKEDIPTWDSLAYVMLMAQIEDKLGINVPIEDIDKIKTLRDMLGYTK